MKFLLIPGSNSLSHIAKCLALQEVLFLRGHKILLAVNEKYSHFLKTIDKDHAIVPDIQEADYSPFPTIQWFKNPQRTLECIKIETELIKKYKPNRVLGVFRFTAKISAGRAGVPYDSLICGCMLPASTEVLGFKEGEPGIETQRENLNGPY